MKKSSKLLGKTFIFKIGNYKAFGGAETQSFILAKHLKARYRARIIFLADNNEGPVKEAYLKEGFEAYQLQYRLHGTKLQKIRDTIKCITLLRSFKPDFLLPYTSDNCKKVLNGWRYTGAKYAWWNMQDEGRFLYKTKHEAQLLKGVTEIVSNSYVGSDFLRAHYDLGQTPIVKYNNPIAQPDPSKIKLQWRKELGIPSDALVVSMLANLTKWKDHTTLLKAWKHVYEHFKTKRPIYLLLAGALKEMTDIIKILAFDLEVAGSVKLLGSINSTNALILESDLVVHSSIKEGVPNAICEAMILGKAVVATDIPGNREAITAKYEHYTLSKPNDARDLGAKIIELLENKPLAKEIGLYNKGLITANYTVEQMVDTFVESFIKHT